MFKELRPIEKGSEPNLGASTLIFIDADGTSTFCSKLACSDLYDLLDVKLPLVSKGKARLLIAWEGQWRTDIFEVTKDTIPLLKGTIKEYGRIWFKSFKR